MKQIYSAMSPGQGEPAQYERTGTAKGENTEQAATKDGKILTKALYPNLSPRANAGRYSETKPRRASGKVTQIIAPAPNMYSAMVNSEKNQDTEKPKQSQSELPDKNEDHTGSMKDH